MKTFAWLVILMAVSLSVVGFMQVLHAQGPASFTVTNSTDAGNLAVFVEQWKAGVATQTVVGTNQGPITLTFPGN